MLKFVYRQDHVTELLLEAFSLQLMQLIRNAQFGNA